MRTFKCAFFMKINVFRKIRNKINLVKLYRKHQTVLDKNKFLKDSQAGKRCFVLGNGPSLRNQDLVKLKDEHTFVTNTFWLHPQYKEINPKYYIIVDDEVFDAPDGQGEGWTDELIKHSALINSLPTKLFFHINGKKTVKNNDLFPSQEIYYLAFAGFFKENLRFNIDLSRILPYPKNVIVATLITASYMGFEEIYLLGCDHSELAVPSQQYYEGFKHFHKNMEYDTNDPEQIKKYALDIFSYETHMYHYQTLFRNYRLLKEKLKKERSAVKIFNATPNSFLDVFPFVNFEDIKI